jgi:hypothetical protein
MALEAVTVFICTIITNNWPYVASNLRRKAGLLSGNDSHGAVLCEAEAGHRITEYFQNAIH